MAGKTMKQTANARRMVQQVQQQQEQFNQKLDNAIMEFIRIVQSWPIKKRIIFAWLLIMKRAVVRKME